MTASESEKKLNVVKVIDVLRIDCEKLCVNGFLRYGENEWINYNYLVVIQTNYCHY